MTILNRINTATLAVLALAMVFSSLAQAVNYPSSWDSARRHVWQIYQDNRFDQYCGCPIGKGNKPDLAACGYQVRKQVPRANRIEMEHVVPAENLGRQFACWREGGRDHCNATDQAFRNAHNDLHGVLPVIGEVNGDRSNFRFDEIAGPANQYGACPFKVDFANRRAEPPATLKGDIARIHYYMRDQHGLRLSDQQERLFGAWHRQDPVSEWERIRDERIGRIQGNRNPYVSGQAVAAPAPAPAPASAPVMPPMSARSSVDILGVKSSGFSCERKTCGAMRSCDEAMYHLNVCGNTRLDGNSDGVPCESICR